MDLIIEKHNKKIKCKLEDQSRNGLDSLPREISLDILSRLPITSVMQSRFVCRAWHTLSLDQNLVNLHLSQATKRNPFLIFHCDYPIRNQLYFVEFSDRDDDKGIVRKINTPFSASMPEFKVVGSCNGLLCLSDSLYNDSVYIYNPFTRDYIELPKSRQYQEQEVVCGFGFCQGTDEYKVVKIVYHWTVDIGFWPARRMRMRGYTKSEVLVFSLGSNTWRSIGKAPYQLERKSPEALFMNERLHWLSRMPNNVRGRRIVSFDLADEQFHEVPRPDFGGRNRRNYHLALLEGCLSAVVYTCGELEIWVMKEYDVKESWIKEFRIGAHVPKILNQNLRRPFRIWKNTFNRTVRVLCFLKTYLMME